MLIIQFNTNQCNEFVEDMKLHEEISSLPGFGLQQSSSAPFEINRNRTKVCQTTAPVF